MRALLQVAIHVEPAAVRAHEAAALMQAVRAACGVALAGDELDFGMGVVHLPVSPHLQAQPFGAGVEIQGRRPGAGMSGGLQVVATFEDKGGVA